MVEPELAGVPQSIVCGERLQDYAQQAVNPGRQNEVSAGGHSE